MLEISWVKILIYALILAIIYIFVKLTNFNIFGKRILSLKWRVVIALLFPVILIIGLVFGAIIFGIILVIFLLFYLNSLFGRKRKFIIRFK